MIFAKRKFIFLQSQQKDQQRSWNKIPILEPGAHLENQFSSLRPIKPLSYKKKNLQHSREFEKKLCSKKRN